MSRSSGSTAKARAMDTRCSMLAESWRGYISAKAVSPTFSITSSTFSRASFRGRFLMVRPKATFCRTVSQGRVEYSCMM